MSCLNKWLEEKCIFLRKTFGIAVRSRTHEVWQRLINRKSKHLTTWLRIHSPNRVCYRRVKRWATKRNITRQHIQSIRLECHSHIKTLCLNLVWLAFFLFLSFVWYDVFDWSGKKNLKFECECKQEQMFRMYHQQSAYTVSVQCDRRFLAFVRSVKFNDFLDANFSKSLFGFTCTNATQHSSSPNFRTNLFECLSNLGVS